MYIVQYNIWQDARIRTRVAAYCTSVHPYNKTKNLKLFLFPGVVLLHLLLLPVVAVAAVGDALLLHLHHSRHLQKGQEQLTRLQRRYQHHCPFKETVSRNFRSFLCTKTLHEQAKKVSGNLLGLMRVSNFVIEKLHENEKKVRETDHVGPSRFFEQKNRIRSNDTIPLQYGY